MPPTIAVIAGTREQAERHAREHGWRRGSYRYISGAHVAQGWHPKKIAVCAKWYDRADYPELRDWASRCEALGAEFVVLC